jgi:hypothetical protein
MKNTTVTRPNFINKLFNSSATKVSSLKDVKVTLRVEDGIVHINNVTGKPEGFLYTLMAEDHDGMTKLMTRYVILAPFQAFADDVDGTRVLAAWEKN